MNDQQFMRIALALQSQAATTLDKNLCSIVSVILLDSQASALSAESIAEQIKMRFSLDFDCLEIHTAIRKKGRATISECSNGYFLTEPAREKLARRISFEDQIQNCIDQYCEQGHCELTIDLKKLILRYVYHCFNASSNNLLYLLHYKELPENSDFVATNEEIVAINNFLAWENAEKNRIIYTLVSVCYEYCLLTVKKDQLVSRSLFRGKKFFLDANIVFRLAGFNNDERKYVTRMFAQKCRDVGIELCYTNKTFDEVFRVISGQIAWIKSFTASQEPIAIESLQKITPDYKANDFYRMYYSWCNTCGNDFADFDSFRSYLSQIVLSVLHGLTPVDIDEGTPWVDMASKQGCISNLMDYKTRRKPRKPSLASVDTDVSNILYVKKVRKAANDTSIWHTNDFFVSADQVLTTWAQQQFSGIPIVVIPSVWLSLILRLGGRSDDDYTAFCSFMLLRTSDTQTSDIDAETIITILNQKTNITSIKERIIDEIVVNKGRYTFSSDADYEASTEKAFDVILQQESASSQQELLAVKHQLEIAAASVPDEEQIRESERRSYRARAIESKAFTYMARFEKRLARAQSLIWIIAAVTLFLLISMVLLWLNDTPVTVWVDGLLPTRLQSLEEQIAFLAFVGFLFDALMTILYNGIVRLFASPAYKEKQQMKFKKKAEQLFESV